MDWIPALLKHLAIARSAVVASFLTSAALLLLPRVAPAYVTQPPASWAPVLLAASLFCGCLLAIWVLEAVSLIAKRCFAVAKVSRALKVSLDRHETGVLHWMGRDPAELWILTGSITRSRRRPDSN
ncbi:hypothetical protein QF025_006976 [Paraburkholderia graminis]|uniref:Uncharacterized protein n=1 Tax=Paraburkholderia graminis TaxID=60548 RepID=A0ABD5CTU1_9BURK|nr:hypothetical protein [Paraburkholderia graminis]